MKRYITVDGGTTNTRVRLIEDLKIIDTVQISRGAKSGIDDKDGLKSALHKAISDILSNNHLKETDIIRILASGMITSEFGLYELPHLIAPVGVSELHDSMQEVIFNEISPIPFVFIRGVKIRSDELSYVDIMRGEETELLGLVDGNSKSCVYILPGSHSKIIKTDAFGRIDYFATMLTGEMIASLSQNTILKDAVDLSLGEFDDEKLLLGYRYAGKMGLNNALFKTRVVKNVLGFSPIETYSFFIGAVLSDEINFLLSLDCDKIILGGKHQIKTATSIILNSLTEKPITVISDERVEISTSIGMIKIYEFNN